MLIISFFLLSSFIQRLYTDIDDHTQMFINMCVCMYRSVTHSYCVTTDNRLDWKRRLWPVPSQQKRSPPFYIFIGLAMYSIYQSKTSSRNTVKAINKNVGVRECIRFGTMFNMYSTSYVGICFFSVRIYLFLFIRDDQTER